MKNDLIKIEELRKLLPENPSKHTVYAWTKNKKIPFEKHGRELFFSKSEILKWIENGRYITKVTR